jgi:putative Mg2+ transporter-C (MgtC) family protein
MRGMGPLTFSDILLRIGAAFAAGALIGCERESRGRPAGLRTNILACLAAAIAMVVSEALFVGSATPGISWRPDPARLGAGILTGIGFLGGGTILRYDNFVRGVTTAASLWFVTVIGLALGSGQFVVGWIGVAVAMVTLFILPRLELYIHADWYVALVVVAHPDGISDLDLRKQLEAQGIEVLKMKLNLDFQNRQRTMEFDIRLPRRQKVELCTTILAQLSQIPGIIQLRWE